MSVSKPPGSGNGDKQITKETQVSSTAPQAGRTAYRYKLHWHVLLIHFPISAFLGSYGFMVLHLITQTTCFELAAWVAMIAGAVVMIPTTITGWRTWKNKYQGIKGKIFIRKITISLVMIPISILLPIIHGFIFTDRLDILHNIWHLIYFLGATVLFLGAVAEGYYGGRLNHR